MPSQLQYFEKKGYLGQRKLNGNCSVIALGPNGAKHVWNRHDAPMQWVMPKDVEATLRQWVHHESTWTVLVGELMHTKVAGGPKNTLYFHDVLVWHGTYLLGWTYHQRFYLLHEQAALMTDATTPVEPGWICLSDKVWLARNFTNCAEVFKSLKQGHFVEGIVMKDPHAKLERCVKETSNSGGAVKCRLGNKNLSF